MIAKELEDLSKAYGKRVLTQYKTAEDFYRLGNAAGRAERLDDAATLYSWAVKINGDYEEAYLYRGVAFAKQGDLNKAVDDFTKTLSLNAKAINNTQVARKPYESFHLLRREYDQDLSVLENRRELALQLRAGNSAALGHCSTARADEKELLRLNPSNTISHQIAMMCPQQ